MSVVAAVKKAVNEGLGDYWMLHLPVARTDSKKLSALDAYFRGCRELDRENKDESRDALIMKASANALAKDGIRGLCF